MQVRPVIRVEFGEHIKLKQLQGMHSDLAACGNVTAEADGRTFLVETYREGGLASLKKMLAGWEKWGFVKWSEVS
jgi:hypothetical protein